MIRSTRNVCFESTEIFELNLGFGAIFDRNYSLGRVLLDYLIESQA